jgi:hypothetical protein
MTPVGTTLSSCNHRVSHLICTDLLLLHCVRLHIGVVRFMLPEHLTNPIGFVELYSIATKLIEQFSMLDTTSDLAWYSTMYQWRTLGLAATVILRLYRSTMELYIDRDRGHRCYFTAIHLLRKRAVTDNDLEAKLATILEKLWPSTMVFRGSDGVVNSIHVRVRGRLVSHQYVEQESLANGGNLTMNGFFDCMWWWRQEHYSIPDPFVAATNEIAPGPSNDTSNTSTMDFPDIFDYDGDWFLMPETTLVGG